MMRVKVNTICTSLGNDQKTSGKMPIPTKIISPWTQEKNENVVKSLENIKKCDC